MGRLLADVGCRRYRSNESVPVGLTQRRRHVRGEFDRRKTPQEGQSRGARRIAISVCLIVCRQCARCSEEVADNTEVIDRLSFRYLVAVVVVVVLVSSSSSSI